MTIDQLERDRQELVAAARSTQPDMVRRLPDSFPLALEFDVEAMAAELDDVSTLDWGAQRTATAGAVVELRNDDWRVLALRSVAGDANRTDPGGADLGLIDWTPHASRFPEIRSFLTSLPLELQAVRLMALEPGGTSVEHVDCCIGLSWGRVRLHVPLVTTPSAHLAFDGRKVHWDRRLWYGSFSLPHYIENLGTRTRTHLVIDGYPRPAFLDLLPPSVRDLLAPGDVLLPAPFQPADPDTGQLVPGEFEIPRSYLNLAAPAGHFVTSTNMARIHADRISNSALALTDDRGSRYVLLRIGQDVYRILGWPHKSVAIYRTPFGVGIRLRDRVGPVTYSRVVPAREP